jgi:hypothetical protein
VGFIDRPYDAYVILGDPKSVPIWMAAEWAKTAARLDPLIAKSRDRGAVRSTQFRPGNGSPNQRAISFGRIGWNENGHRKWVHPETNAGDSQDGVEFLTAEVWAPSWTVCEKEQVAPEAFFGVRNESSSGLEKLAFRQFVILAVAADQGDEFSWLGRKVATQISEQVAAVLRAYRRRTWGYRLDHPEREANIGDYLVSSPFKPGPVQTWEMSLEIFKRQWSKF